MNNELLSQDTEVSDVLPPLLSIKPRREEQEHYFRTHPQTYEVLWNCGFLIFGDAPLFSRPLTVSEQLVRTPDYRCDCKMREADPIRYFCYTLSGQGGITDASGSYVTNAGEAFLVETNNPLASYYYPPSATEPWRFLAFAFHGLQAHVMVRAMLQKYGPIYRIPKESRIIQRLLSFEGPRYTPGQTHIHQMQLYEAIELTNDLMMALTAAHQPADPEDQSQDLVQQAVAIITSGEVADLRVSDVARQIGVSREYLSRLFHSRLGKSPRTFILEQKIERACLLLRETNIPIKTIADRLGYTAYPNFSNAFQQIMRMTPREYRRTGGPSPWSLSPSDTRA
jgi:AraC-like DNA-binding protein